MPDPIRPRRRGSAEWIAFACFAAIVVWQTMIPPIVGLANNGDFGKVLAVFELAAPTENEYKFISTTYHFHPRNRIAFGVVSSEHLLAGVAILLNTPLSKTGTFDIRMAGAVHGALYLLGFFLLLPLLQQCKSVAKALIYTALVVIFSDVMYVAWLNSFYMDTAAWLFFVLAAVLYVRWVRWSRAVDFAGFVLCAILFASAKAQHAVLALPIVFLVAAAKAPGIRLRAVAASFIAAAAAFSWVYVPAEYGPKGMFSVIFYEIMPGSKNVDGDLRQLGLDSSYSKWAGAHAFSPGAPMDDEAFVREFSARTSYGRIGWFFACHPSRAYRAIRNSLSLAGRQRVFMGNFDRSAGAPEFAESKAFAFWSGVKRGFLEERGPRYVFWFLGICAALGAGLYRRRRSIAMPAGVCLLAMATISLLVSSFADAIEVTRHFFLFNALADTVLVSALISFAVRPRRAS